jgi:hypothetical protein
MQIPVRLRHHIVAIPGAIVLLLSGGAHAFDSRAWLTADGKMTDATFVHLASDSVELKGKSGEMIRLPRALLSFGDVDYLKNNAPPEKVTFPFSKPATVEKLPNPAKEIAMDRKQIRMSAGEQVIGATTFRVCETPHFKILYLPPAEPLDVGELAERLWIDTAFFHGSFMEKWRDRRMAIVLAHDDAAFGNAMRWSAGGELDRAGPRGSTGTVRSTGTVLLPSAVSDKIGIFDTVRVFRACYPSKTDGKPSPVKGVWIPLHVNALAEDLLYIRTGGLTRARIAWSMGFSREGFLAIYSGAAYEKEILLTGRSETRLIGNEGGNTRVQQMTDIQSGKTWAAQLKSLMKKGGGWSPRLRDIMTATPLGVGSRDILSAYAFCRFLRNSTDRLTAFNALFKKVEAAKQVPDVQEIAVLYGFTDAAALEKAWIDWMNSPLFR